jgi:murein DD-endopeptidase MepM/ murein hydrolase activator NlpD
MKGQYRIFLIFLAFTFIIGCAFFKNSYADGDAVHRDILDLDDSIIINGLKMNDSESIESNGRGGIVYDDSFFPESQNAIQDSSSKTKGRTFDDLVKRDNRWHYTEYTVKKHDTIWDIARRFNTDYKLIINSNTVSDPGMLHQGSMLRIPNTNGLYYTVKKGDTLLVIARQTGVSIKKIKSHNSINNTIRCGLKLFIPDAVEIKGKISSRVTARPHAKTIIADTRFAWPASGKISSSFGNRLDPFSRTKKFHCGIDISLEPGRTVRAARDGRVIFSGWKEGYGNVVVIRHDKGYITVYAHNRSNIVSLNDIVKRSEKIALSGMTGAVTGAHLHFEIRKYLTPLNPIKMLR